MKWPRSITLIRHGQSAYNVLKDIKMKDPRYREFMNAFEIDHQSKTTRKLAKQMEEKYSLQVSDYETQLTDEGIMQAQLVGKSLSQTQQVPDAIFCSPYMRTKSTLVYIREGWPDLAQVPVFFDDRIREQEHGLALLYNDWRIFQVFHPEQKRLRDLMGPYWYQFPQGESISNVRDRIRLMTSMLIREWAEKDVWLITHHITILSKRANIEHLTPEQFIHLDETEKPINCGVTRYECNPELGRDGKLELVVYNSCLFK